MKIESKTMFNLLMNSINQLVIQSKIPQPFETDLTQDLERNDDTTKVISLLTSGIGGDELHGDSRISLNSSLSDTRNKNKARITRHTQTIPSLPRPTTEPISAPTTTTPPTIPSSMSSHYLLWLTHVLVPVASVKRESKHLSWIQPAHLQLRLKQNAKFAIRNKTN